MKGEPGPCRYKFCSPPTCKRYEMIPGTCCGFNCLEDEEENLGICTNNLRRNGTPPLIDALPFEINIENYFLMIGIICIYLLTLGIAQLVER